jgi:zinc finger protein ZFPM1
MTSVHYLTKYLFDLYRSQSPSSAISKIPPNGSLNPSHRSSLYICRLCKYRGNTIRGMRMHFKLHLSNNEPCSDDDIITKPINNPSLTIPRTNQLLLKCKICSAMFDYEDTLLTHIKCVHTDDTFIECLECQSRFCSKWNLLRHMRLTHTNIKYDDEDDDKQHSKSDEKEKSSTSMNPIRHIMNLPKQIPIKRKFTCPYCHIKFGCADTLKQHMITYCSSRPTTDDLLNNIKKEKKTDFYCSACQISFQHKTSYDAHKMYYCHGDSKARIKIQV